MRLCLALGARKKGDQIKPLLESGWAGVGGQGAPVEGRRVGQNDLLRAFKQLSLYPLLWLQPDSPSWPLGSPLSSEF